MLPRARWVGLALSAALLATGTGLRADDEKGDLKKMQGTWTCQDPIHNDTSKWVFDGDSLKVTSPLRNYDTKVSLDTKDKPKQIDFKINDANPDAKGLTGLGIYKFDEDYETLTICIGGRENYRPEAFETEPGKSFVFELKKQK